MEEKKKEELKKEKTNNEKQVQNSKLGPAATVLLTLASALGIIVLVAVIYSFFKVL